MAKILVKTLAKPLAEQNTWHGQAVVAPPAAGHYLIVDDNDRYAAALAADAQARGGTSLRARSAREGIDLYRERFATLAGVITDIDMETQLAGLRVVYYLNRQGFRGILAVATTGLDAAWAFRWNRWVFSRLLPVDYLIPKRPIRQAGQVLWLQTGAQRHTYSYTL